MYGANPRRKVDHNPEDGKIAVQDIFYTIQGEGPFGGMPAVFIRLAGCHLACTFCDTEFESGMGNRLTVDEIVSRALNTLSNSMLGLRMPMVVMTGGEPLRQTTGPLAGALVKAGFSMVQYETAGNLWDETLRSLLERGMAHLVTSPKTPQVHPMIARYCRHYKYVLSHDAVDPVDGLPRGSTQDPPCGPPWRPWEIGRDTDLLTGHTSIWVSPCDAHDPVANQRNMSTAAMSCMRYGYRLSLQTHKILNLP